MSDPKKGKPKGRNEPSETERSMAATIQAMTAETLALRNEAATLREENARLKDEVLHLQGLPTTCQLLQSELRSSEEKLAVLQRERDQNMAEWQVEHTKLLDQVATLTNTNRLVAAQTAQHAEEVAVLRQKIVDKDAMIIALRSRAVSDGAAEELETEIKELKKKLQKEADRSQQLDVVQEECNQLLTRIGKLQQQNWAYEQRLQQLEGLVATLQQDNEKKSQFARILHANR
eukprot:TRINITY_DN6164_c0_g1_i1.p1 TRINITY_DN6164_c0_g1~~TRINITY_DN6164_c0_g1_i1.p1  ORF type:complete len:232 (+),score=56.74 TRINITY_DN6164_c0_g1_i1:46-741(+)